MAKQTLKEYLVGLGFAVDERTMRQFDKALTATEESIAKVGIASTAALVLVDRNVTQVAQRFSNLYYTSKLSGASVKSLESWGYAAQQIGVDSKEAQGSILAMGRALRLNPGLGGLLNSYGIKTKGRETTAIANDLIDTLAKMPEYQSAPIGQMFGFGPDELKLLEDGRKKMHQVEQERRQQYKSAGLDPDKMASDSRDYINQLNQFNGQLDIFRTLVAKDFMPGVNKLLVGLNRIMSVVDHWNQQTNGASTAGIAAGVTVGGALGVRGTMSLLRKFLGLGGKAGAAAGEGAEGAAAVGAETGLAAAVLAPIVVGVLSALGIAWILKRTGTADKLEKFGEQHSVSRTAAAVGKWLGGEDFTRKAEGFVGQIYGDLGKLATVGYGHRVLAGENFSGGLTKPQAEALFQKDLAKARGQVLGLTSGVALTKGQQDALTDFQFNTGGLAGSSILRDLKAGKNDQAAKDFEKWDKVRIGGTLVHSDALYKRRLGEEAMFRGGPNVKIEQHTTIHVASDSPEAAGRQVQRVQSKVNGDLVRNAGTGMR